jgi:hypothetical protein
MHGVNSFVPECEMPSMTRADACMMFWLTMDRSDHPNITGVILADAWDSIQDLSMDFRAVITAFFTFPDFFATEHGFGLGRRANGFVVEAVVLSPEAATPHAFHDASRYAPEFPHVSPHLREWRDLILGAHSRMLLADKVDNVVHAFLLRNHICTFCYTILDRTRVCCMFRNSFYKPSPMHHLYVHSSQPSDSVSRHPLVGLCEHSSQMVQGQLLSMTDCAFGLVLVQK